MRRRNASPSSARAIDFEIRGEHIALDALLKAAGLTGSGGEGKVLIAGGTVRVDGAVELRRGCKLRPGQRVEVGPVRIRLHAVGAVPGITPEHPQTRA
ncbi:MAG: RNA-binding S4 domain-containing protein [Betaproteobacteria bacterium]|nr:RNA-binding S4 domain-containing protein [Betaproteobacteria bacterium]